MALHGNDMTIQMSNWNDELEFLHILFKKWIFVNKWLLHWIYGCFGTQPLHILYHWDVTFWNYIRLLKQHWAFIWKIMMTSSNGNIFRVTGHFCGEFTGHRWFPAQNPVTRNLDFFFDLRLNKCLSKQWWGWWFETSWRPLWRHCNVRTYKLNPMWCLAK